MEHGQESRHIGRGLTGKLGVEIPEVIKVVDSLRSDPIHDGHFAAVVGGQRSGPVPEHLVKLLEISDGRCRRLLNIHPFVNPLISFQAESVSG